MKAELYTRYPLAAPLTYNGTTIAHFVLGGIGLAIGYRFIPWLGVPLGIVYLSLALLEMYVLMPLQVCPNCVYYELENSRCISGLNLLSRRIAKKGDVRDFPKRAEGVLCSNNRYMAALFVPIIAMIPALIIRFSFALLAVFLGILVILLFRFFILFPKIACLHCRAKHICPQADQMGVREL
ncbi:hypothetical protein ACFLSZ_03165 [Candidatus Bipolaricaulota bacterium]